MILDKRPVSGHLRFALATLLLCSAATAVRAEELRKLDRERAHLMLKVLRKNFEKHYYDPAYRGMDVETRFEQARVALDGATSLKQAFGVIAQVLVELEDPHTLFVPPERTNDVQYGWQMRLIGETPHVVAVKPGSDAEAKGLKVGDVVLAVNETQPTRGNFWKIGYRYYVVRPEPGLSLIVQSPGGPERQVDAYAKVRREKRFVDLTQGDDIWQRIRRAETARPEHRTFETKDKKLFIWSMPTSSVHPDRIEDLADKMHKFDAVILDLRGNGGGYTKTREWLLGYFFKRDVLVGQTKDRKGKLERRPSRPGRCSPSSGTEQQAPRAAGLAARRTPDRDARAAARRLGHGATSRGRTVRALATRVAQLREARRLDAGRLAAIEARPAGCGGARARDLERKKMIRLGHVREIARYPVKSMAGVATDSATLGWHGLDGDRRFAFWRSTDQSGFPWLSASRLPELVLYRPFGLDQSSDEPLPTHVRTPEGASLEIGSAELNEEVSRRFGGSVELMRLKHGIYDEAPVSVIGLATVAGIGRRAGMELDIRRFRANIVLETLDAEPFLEDGWVGGRLVFGDGEPEAVVSVTLRDVRCMMINLDPETARQDPQVMRAVVGLNDNHAGVYATVVRTGRIHAGQAVSLALDPRR
jgi:uncharacterized protein